MVANHAVSAEPAAPACKIDLGCGSRKHRGPDGQQNDWIGLDRIAFEGVDHVLDLGREPWPLADGSVAEAYSSHFLEHLERRQRVHFCNELYRVLAPGGKCLLIVPHWSSCRAYGDMTHCWPPVSEFWFYYLSREWRAGNAPHDDRQWSPDGYGCDFEVTWGYSMNPALAGRNAEFQQFANSFYREAIFDMVATITKK
jgi:predicted SAM-dependent methyltransferase